MLYGMRSDHPQARNLTDMPGVGRIGSRYLLVPGPQLLTAWTLRKPDLQYIFDE
jgi:hypothetical protein